MIIKSFRQFAPLALCLIILCAACQRKPTSTADIPRLLPSSNQISVAPFTQPVHPGQLISGQIPEPQGRVNQESLLNLDMRLREALIMGTKRQYDFLPASTLPTDWSKGKATGQPTALEKWIEYGAKHKAQFLLVPQVIDWHEREGSQAGVTNSAHIRVEFYLLNIPRKTVYAKSVFEEKQVGLIDNLLTMPEFLRRRGQWVSAGDLASDGMTKAIADIGL